jgi:ribosomal protein L12E/L44/L45/RPP1/RPP2
MTENMQKSYEERLASLWQQGNREIAVAFLKRAITADITLEQLAKALQFPQVREHLQTVGLRDVLAPAPNPAPTAASAAGATTHAPAERRQKKVRRRRRGAAEVQALKDAVMGRLQSAVSPVTTPHLCEVLAKGGHDVDLLQMNRLLNTLSAEGYVHCLGGKPKAWRLKPQGRTAPEPLVIRKAMAAVTPANHT